MNRPDLPLKILGLISPVLSWVEGHRATTLPDGWGEEDLKAQQNNITYGFGDKVIGSVHQRDWLLQQLPTYSLDNIDDLFALSKPPEQSNQIGARWQPLRCQLTPPLDYNLIDMFDYLANRYLTWDGGKAVIKRQHMLELHALGLRMPLAFMVQHFHARAVANGDKKLESILDLPESISLLSSNSTGVRHVIDRGLSEGHLHLNALHAAENNWADTLLNPQKPKSLNLTECRLQRYATAVARTLALATTLIRAKRNMPAKWGLSIHEILDKWYFAKEIHLAEHFEHEFEKLFAKYVQTLLYYKEILSSAELRDNKEILSSAELRAADKLFAHGVFAKGLEDKLFGLFLWLDPWYGSHWRTLNRHSTYPMPSTTSARRAYVCKLHLAAHLALIQAPLTTGNRKSDKNVCVAGNFLHRSLFRYMVIQTHHWQLAVQQGRTTGLRHFNKYYHSKQRRPVDTTPQANAKAVFDQVSQWKGLDVLEGRITPPKKERDDLLPWVKAFAQNVEQGNRIQKFGLIIHFTKEQSTARSKAITKTRLPRYFQQRDKYRREAFHLFYILQKSSPLNPFIVGIDAASFELATPPAVFAPIFRFLRDAPIEVRVPPRFDSHSPDNLKLHQAIKRLVKHRRLGMTYHVGEEFRHLLSGLRAIDEVTSFLNPQPGDRLGHALALGLDPKVWLQQTGSQILVPKQEWLDTLVWLHHHFGSGNELLARLHIENDIECLAREIYKHKNVDRSPFQLWNVWLLRQLDPDSIDYDDKKKEIKFRPLVDNGEAAWRWNRIGTAVVKSICKKVGKNPPYGLLDLYWYNADARKEGSKLHFVDMEDQAKDWIDICHKMQQMMQQKIIDKQMIVETNPSSNLSIGTLSRMQEHPIFNMAFDKDGNWQQRLKMTVNTDNPGTANTSLAHEFYLLAETLLDMNYPEVKITQWLEWLRQCGKESSFIRHMPPPDDEDMQIVLQAVLALGQQNKCGTNDVAINKWFNSLNGQEENLEKLIDELFQSNKHEQKATLLRAILRKVGRK